MFLDLRNDVIFRESIHYTDTLPHKTLPHTMLHSAHAR